MATSITIPPEFNESEDDGNILRTIIDFKLFNLDGDMISLSDIGEGKPPARLEGTLIEPLPGKWKEKLLEILCSRPPPNQPLSTGILSAQPPNPVPIADWDVLKVGDLVDGFCTRTLKWYEAKIVEIEKNVTAENPSGLANSFKIHFKRWKSKYDEWIPRGSPRLSVHGSSTEKKLIPYSAYTPWFENSIAYQKLEELMGPLPPRKTLSVVIDSIEDCCFDFMYANPSLWLVAGDNSWYRLAGPLVPHGCRPLSLYEPLLAPFILKFVAAAHTAYCLIDFLPQNRKLTLSDVASEIESRTGGRINEQTLLKYHEFITQHIETLVHPDDWDQQISFIDSVFLAQLKKKGPASEKTNGSIVEIPQDLLQVLFDFSLGVQNSDDVKVKAKRNSLSKKSLLFLEEDPVGAQRTLKGTPIAIPDEELWEVQTNSGFPPPPYPFENKSLHSNPIHDALSPAERSFLPVVLRIWSILYNYQSLLPTVPIYSLEELLTLLISKSHDSCWFKESCPHALLRDIHVACLDMIIRDRRNSELSYTPVNDSQQRYPNSPFHLSSYQNNDGENIDGQYSKPIHNSITLWELLSQCSENNVRQILRSGESWVEIGRLLLTERSQYLVSDNTKRMIASEYVDPIGEIGCLLESLIISPQGQNFQPSDTSHSLPAILDRILSGYYERSSLPTSENLLTGFFGQRLLVGEIVDAFCQITRCWHEAKIVDIISLEFSDPQIKVVIPNSWIHPLEYTFDLNSRWIAPSYSVSVNEQFRRVHPDDLSTNFINSIRTGYSDRNKGKDPSILSSLHAIADEVRQLLRQNILDEPGTESLMSNQALQLQKTFEAGYESILSTFTEQINKREQIDKLSSKTLEQSDLPTLFMTMSTVPYSLLSFQSRVLFLNWLCGEFICTSAAKTFIDDVAERKWKFEKDIKAKRLQTLDQPDSEDEPEEEEPTSHRTSRSKRPRSQNLQNLEPPSPPKKGRVKYVSDPNVNLVEEEAFLSKVELRFQPIGVDRNWRRYWRFTQDKHPMRLFCEDPNREEWFILSKQSQFQELMTWLSVWGKNESKLKHGLLCCDAKGSPTNYDDSFPVPLSRIQDRYEGYLGSLDGNPMVHMVTLTLTDGGQLEAGVKDIERRIILTTFKFNSSGRSAAHNSGLKIADQFLSVNGVWIEDIQALQRALKVAQAGVFPGQCAVLNVLVLRYKQPTRCPVLRVASESDPDFKKWMDPRSAIPPSTEVASSREFPSLIGSVVEMIYALCEPWLTHSELVELVRPSLMILMQQMSSGDRHPDFLSPLKDILLHMEAGLWLCKRGLKKWWLTKRTHFRWRMATTNCTSFAAICSSFAILQQAVDWSLVDGVQSCVTLSRCRELLPKHPLESYVPTVGDKFLYYPDGHLRCLEILKLRYQFELPRCQFHSKSLESLSGRVFLCQAINIRYYPGGHKGMLDKSCPYFRLELRVLPDTDESFPSPPTLHTLKQDANDLRRHRLFNRVLNILYGLPEGEPFINPVSQDECPDYYDVIAHPMNLVEVAKKVKQQTYQTPEDFLADISLIRSNCVEYCSQKFPALVADAEVLYEAAVSAIGKMRDEFEATHSEEDGNSANEEAMNIETESSSLNWPGEVWTIFVPLNRSLTEIDFLVSVAIYIKACTKRQYFLEDKVCMRKGTFHVAATSSSDVLESQYVLYISLASSPHLGLHRRL